MAIRIGINGFGRMGRVAMRAAWDWPELEIVHINDPGGDAETMAHLLTFDSVHGRWDKKIGTNADGLVVDGRSITYSSHRTIPEIDWNGAQIVVDCSGHHKTSAMLKTYLDHGIERVVVSCPVKDGPLNIVMGVNDHLYDPDQHPIVTAASCTTNCLAPVVKVLHEKLGIVHGSMTTIHSVTNTQSILDQPHKDLRRARAYSSSLIPTSTGSASAIAIIFPELKGKLNGLAVRVPTANASITDSVFEVARNTSVEEVNDLFKAASEGTLKGILGYEERPLVSIDYTSDPRSGIVDALSTMVVDDRHVKTLTWYDNEAGYAHRLMEVAKMVGSA